MRNRIVIICLFILAIITCLYFLIPAVSGLNYQTSANCTETAAARQITDKSKWNLWWPGKQKNDSTYSYKNCNYRIEKIMLNGIETTVYNDKISVKGVLQFIYDGTDSTEFRWTFSYVFSQNPITRFSEYFTVKEIQNNVEDLLKSIKKYFDRQENIYGMKIVKQKVTQSSMISTKKIFPHYPTTQEIYEMINSLKEYIKEKNGKEASYPMLNVYKEENNIYETMVAIPTKTDLPSEGDFRLKNMVLGNILMAEVKGGIYNVLKGEEELANYLNDYKKISPAIPFQSLVTNRKIETDTTKWITRLYYPIFN